MRETSRNHKHLRGVIGVIGIFAFRRGKSHGRGVKFIGLDSRCPRVGCIVPGMGTPPFYFGHRQPPPVRSESPFTKFTVRCGKCHCERLRAVSDMDDDSGELVIYLVCPCGQREKIPVR